MLRPRRAALLPRTRMRCSSTGAGSKITISGSAFALLALEPSISTWPLPADVRAVAPSWVGFPRGSGMGGMEVSKSAPQGGCSVHGIPGAVTRRGPGRTKYTVVPTQEPLSRDLAHAGDGQGGDMAWLPGGDGREDSASSIRGCFQGQARPKGGCIRPRGCTSQELHRRCTGTTAQFGHIFLGRRVLGARMMAPLDGLEAATEHPSPWLPAPRPARSAAVLCCLPGRVVGRAWIFVNLARPGQLARVRSAAGASVDITPVTTAPLPLLLHNFR
ncbi:hypothetical protein ACCO45_013687 [Purpureocillium lilacinum]|uniref:Uncharacterized protein n=1 Tax=Purpureocillium lilacinum TaxID=33203 RepID=A0ACC4D6R2_PURLI